MLPEIVPAVLTQSLEEFEKCVRAVEAVVRRLQIDVVDGFFADNKTLSLEAMAGVETPLRYDFHLMVRSPRLWIEKCALLMPEVIIGHVEEMKDQRGFVTGVIEAGMRPGLAVNLPTKLESLDPKALEATEAVLLMAVSVGFQGQKFDRRVLSKIKKLKKLKEEMGFRFKVVADGGLNKENALEVARAGAEELAVGSAIFGQEDPVREIRELREILKKAGGKS